MSQGSGTAGDFMPKKLTTYVPVHRRANAPLREPTVDPFYLSKGWRAVREAVLIRDLWVCQYCGVDLHGFDATVDHVKARAVGGDDLNPDNLKASCRSCNSRKGKR